jgi:hypothetical protein
MKTLTGRIDLQQHGHSDERLSFELECHESPTARTYPLWHVHVWTQLIYGVDSFPCLIQRSRKGELGSSASQSRYKRCQYAE